ncbi:MAG: winged helix-turn-helix transcriptional regulator [Acetobacteraceae bacterium]|nr:winged helix-turn-helix transcriptional regulator [Acetobacteraceae bacterium]
MTRASAPLAFGPLTLDPSCQVVAVGECSVQLRGQECAVLAALMRRPSEVVSHDTLLEALYPGPERASACGLDVLRAAVCRLRRALAGLGAGLHVSSVYGSGYLLEVGGQRVGADVDVADELNHALAEARARAREEIG